MRSVISTLFNNAKQQIDAMNDSRICRALAAMSPASQQVYTLLPVLLHYNHPSLPGFYSADTPAGICSYSPSDKENQQLSTYISSDDNSLSINQQPGILGVYSMGSTGSIGQNVNSDVDVWVCYDPCLTGSGINKLNKKCKRITRWASKLGVDINFFLIEQDRFRHNEYGCLDEENCGSTQNILLLDEFYRSMVRLAGKRILWGVVPYKYEAENYDSYVQQLVDEQIINFDEWLDFGSLGALSAKEYFGSSLWQLYKSIDSPYKAVLKTLLLEAYSWEYPNTLLLASETKKNASCFFADVDSSLDSYLIMLARVTRYLTSIGDTQRLDLARRCFYLKVCEKLSENENSEDWRYQALSQLVKEWEWSEEKIKILDNRESWKIEQVRKAHNELLDAMMQSYRSLIRFARKNSLSVSASPQDIGILTRKLYAAFEALPGKITLYNPMISPDLSERNLTFIQVKKEGVNCKGWYLYNQSPVFDKIVCQQPLEYNPYLSKLIAWCYFNGLLTEETLLHIKSHSPFDAEKINHFAKDITSNFLNQVPAPTAQALYSPCEIRQLTIAVNLENDPTQEFYVREGDICKPNVFSFGSQQKCLIGSVDLLYRNSWNEVRTLHFNGEQAMLDALKTILGKMHQDARKPESLQVFCYSSAFNSDITEQVEKLVTEAIEQRLSVIGQEQAKFKAIHIAGQTWGLFFERLSVSVQKLENAIDFYGAISNNKLGGLSAYRQSNSIELPAVIDGVASEGIIQFFFKDSGKEFTLYILNEANGVEIYQHCEGHKIDLIYEISNFYASSHARSSYGSGSVNFNLPQFYQIIILNGVEQVVPFNYNSINYTSHSSLNTATY